MTEVRYDVLGIGPCARSDDVASALDAPLVARGSLACAAACGHAGPARRPSAPRTGRPTRVDRRPAQRPSAVHRRRPEPAQQRRRHPARQLAGRSASSSTRRASSSVAASRTSASDLPERADHRRAPHPGAPRRRLPLLDRQRRSIAPTRSTARSKPIARLPDGIQTISFAPKFCLVRTRNGERWALGLPSGERMAIEPLGAADVEGLDDGRALAFNDSGAAFSSIDSGAHWIDVTSQVKSSPTRVAVIDDELWLFESSGGALRLEPDGQLSTFDKQPPETPPEMRARDPRWRGVEAPLRTAFHTGASIDESTAIVVEQGDIVRVDVHTGEITGIVAGKLPPDARCEAVPTANDVLFACVSRGSQRNGGRRARSSSRTRSRATRPSSSRRFQSVAQFYALRRRRSRDRAPCTGSPSSPAGPRGLRAPARRHVAGLRSLGAHGRCGLLGDVNVARWVPRADGRAVAILLDPTPGIYDPRTGTARGRRARRPRGARAGRSARLRDATSVTCGGIVRSTATIGSALVDWSWSFSATRLASRVAAARRHRRDLTDDGKVTRSPYAFDIGDRRTVRARSHAGRTLLPVDRSRRVVDRGRRAVLRAPRPASSARAARRAAISAASIASAGRSRPPRVEAPPTAARSSRRRSGARVPSSSRVVPPVPRQRRCCRAPATRPRISGSATIVSRSPASATRSRSSATRCRAAIVHPLHETSIGRLATRRRSAAMLTGFGTTTRRRRDRGHRTEQERDRAASLVLVRRAVRSRRAREEGGDRDVRGPRRRPRRRASRPKRSSPTT